MNSLLSTALLVAALAGRQPETLPDPSEIEKLKRQVAQLEDDVMEARAARAKCELDLGPIEVQLRRQFSEQRWAALKADLERARGGPEKVSCDPRTLKCTEKPPTKPPPAR